ncbi:hypothetical protein [Photobacterium kasasachensis]|uniref:hypothetical protein n=1 Tax=Photobacterium kasasachensis TaxID=2910240 RepID=UPI003D119204
MKYLAILFLLPFSVLSMELETSGFLVTIKSNCAEGEVSCNNYVYTGISKKTGNSLTLKGASWHTVCADQVTPCRFLGYKFKNGNVTYYIRQNGLLQVIKNRNEVILSEQGEWK